MEPVLQKPNQLFARAAKVENSQARITAGGGFEFKAWVFIDINLRIRTFVDSDSSFYLVYKTFQLEF